MRGSSHHLVRGARRNFDEGARCNRRRLVLCPPSSTLPPPTKPPSPTQYTDHIEDLLDFLSRLVERFIMRCLNSMSHHLLLIGCFYKALSTHNHLIYIFAEWFYGYCNVAFNECNHKTNFQKFPQSTGCQDMYTVICYLLCINIHGNQNMVLSG